MWEKASFPRGMGPGADLMRRLRDFSLRACAVVDGLAHSCVSDDQTAGSLPVIHYIINMHCGD